MNEFDSALTKFEEAWRNGETPSITDFLVADDAPVEFVAKLIRLDIEFRWRRNAERAADTDPIATANGPFTVNPVLEDYVKHLSQLGSRDELPVEIIAHEFEVRTKWGDRPSVESYHQRFPNQYEDFCTEVKKQQNEQTVIKPAQDGLETAPGAVQRNESQTVAPDSGNAPTESAIASHFRTSGELPEQFGRYRILKTLGVGGMGAVYLGEDPDLERKVAIKVPFFDPGEGTSVLDRFRREAKSIAALHHPNICPIFEVGEKEGIHYMSMAFIEGKPLSDYVRPDKGQDIRSAVKLVRKIALALKDAHQQGVIHRDLKPANIMIDRRKEPIVMDFGLARREGKADTQLTTAGQIMGTPSYMPPEQVAGQLDEMGPGCDIYSLGVILYELVTGRLPFQGDVLAILSQIAINVPDPPSTFRAEIDEQLDAICLKAMEKKPEDRYASMAEFAQALSEYAKRDNSSEEAALQPKPEDVLVELNQIELISANSVSPSSIGLIPTPHVPRKPTGSNQKTVWIAAIAGGAALLLLVAAIIFFGQSREGTLLVEINDPEIEVAIQDTDIVLKKTDQAEINLPPGKKTLVVQRGDVKFETDEFSLKKGEKIIVHVELLLRELRARQGENVIGRKRLPSSLLAKAPVGDPRATNGKKEQQGEKAKKQKTTSVASTQSHFPKGWFQLTTKSAEAQDLVLESVPLILKKRDNYTGMSWKAIQHIDGYYCLTSQFLEAQNQVLEGSDGSGPAIMQPKSEVSGTHWKAIPADDGYFYLTTNFVENSGKVLAGNVGDSAGNNAMHQGMPYMTTERTADTQWKFISIGNGQKPPLATAPFGNDVAKKHQQAWANYLGLPIERKVAIPSGEKLPLVLIPPGEFMMGDEEFAPLHRVRITKPFYLSKYEVTQGLWQTAMGTTPWKGKERVTEGANNPVTNVSFNEVQGFLGKLNEINKAEKLTFVLPTEAQWEHACRAGTTTPYSKGEREEDLRKVGWFRANSNRKIHPFGELEPNAFGLHDMHGNVWEWCSDWHANDFYENSPIDDPTGPLKGTMHVTRGGGWDRGAEFSRSSCRGRFYPNDSGFALGFRVATTAIVKSDTPGTQSPVNAKKNTKTEQLASLQWAFKNGLTGFGETKGVFASRVVDRFDAWKGNLPKLAYARIKNDRPGQASEVIAHLAQITELKNVEMEGAKVPLDQDFAAAINSIKLETLRFHCPINESVLKSLSSEASSRIKSFGLLANAKNGVTDKQVALATEKFPNLFDIHINGQHLGPESDNAIAKTSITNMTLLSPSESFQRQLGKLTKIRVAMFISVKTLDASNLPPNIEALYLQNVDLDASHLEHLAKLKNLKSIAQYSGNCDQDAAKKFKLMRPKVRLDVK